MTDEELNQKLKKKAQRLAKSIDFSRLQNGYRYVLKVVASNPQVASTPTPPGILRIVK